MAEIEQLSGANQMLAFEPMDFGPLFGGPRGRGTIGGVLAANQRPAPHQGRRRARPCPRRERCHGRGEAFKSGGRW